MELMYKPLTKKSTQQEIDVYNKQKWDFTNYILNNKHKFDVEKIKKDPKKYKELANNFFKTGTIWDEYMLPQQNQQTSNIQTPVQTQVNKPEPVPEVKKPEPVPETNNEILNKSLDKNIDTKWTDYLWATSTHNINDDAYNANVNVYKKQQEDNQKALNNEEMLWGQLQSNLKKETNKLARDRVDEQQKQLDLDRKNSESNIQKDKEDAYKLVQDQKRIAWRQANIASYRATASWLQLSEQDLQSIEDDVISKYWDKINNAQQFANQTNISLNSALKSIAWDHFKTKESLNKYIDSLDVSEEVPLMNALKAATDWNKKAINDVNSLVEANLKTKVWEEFNRASEVERLESNNRQFANMNDTQKRAKLMDDLSKVVIDWVETDVWSMLVDDMMANPNKYKWYSYSDLMALGKKIWRQHNLMNSPWLINYVNNKNAAEISWKKFTLNPMYEEALKQWLNWLEIANSTNEQKVAAWSTDSWKDVSDLVIWDEIITTGKPVTWKKLNTLKDNASKLSTKSKASLDELLKTKSKKEIFSKMKDSLQKGTINKITYDRVLAYIYLK